MIKRYSYNTQNLIQFDQMPLELHRELSARGGRASGETRRRRAEARKAAEQVFQCFWELEELDDEWLDFQRWKKRRDQARRKRTKSEPGKNR